jgi:DNA-binding LacI/PurR family transcriptional regulator
VISSLELARLAGVSQGTVDRALHGRSGVAAATRTRILALAERHGYQANPVAREMMGLANSPLVGAVVHDMGGMAVFFTRLMTTIHRRLRQDGLHLVMSYGSDATEQREVATHLLARRLRALLLVHAQPGALPMASGIPLAALVLEAEGATPLLPDEQATGRGAAAALLSLGHRRLCVISRGEHAVAAARRDGFTSVVHAAGAQVVVAPGIAEALTAVAGGATAVMCHNDPQAEALIAALASRGLSCPRDVSVVGVDGATDDRRIATMAYPFAAIAESVAALIAGIVPAGIPECRWRDGSSAARL